LFKGRVWHWSQPPGGGIAFQLANMAQPARRAINDPTINNVKNFMKIIPK